MTKAAPTAKTPARPKLTPVATPLLPLEVVELEEAFLESLATTASLFFGRSLSLTKTVVVTGRGVLLNLPYL